MLLPLKFCVALFLISAQAFSGISARESLREKLALKRETFPLTALNAGLNGSFDQSNGPAWLIRRDKLTGIVENLLEEIIAFKDLVDQPEFQRFFKGHHAPRGRNVD